jgi:aminoglycoside phosphotransferase (APT) family kinase protein
MIASMVPLITQLPDAGDEPVACMRTAQLSIPQDWSALRDYLSNQGMRLDLDVPPRQFAAGLGNLNYLLSVDGKPVVLRRPPAGRIPPGANDMRREHRILAGLWRVFPLAPRALHYCASDAVIGAHFLLMEYRRGVAIGGRLPTDRDLSLTQRQWLSETLVDLLSRLHAVDPAQAGLESLGRPEGMLLRMVDGWQQRAELASVQEHHAAIRHVTDWLRRHLPSSQACTLLHSDFKLDNVLLHPERLEVVAVIDWDMGTRGDPLVDLATLLSYWVHDDDPPALQALGQMPTAEPGFLRREDILARYARATGFDLGRFHWYRVMAMFKLAAVFLQLHDRFVRGDSLDERHRSCGPLSAGLLAHVADLAGPPGT